MLAVPNGKKWRTDYWALELALFRQVGFDLCGEQGAKKIILTACHSGKLKLACTRSDVV